jgi:hypothetical protein
VPTHVIGKEDFPAPRARCFKCRAIFLVSFNISYRYCLLYRPNNRRPVFNVPVHTVPELEKRDDGGGDGGQDEKNEKQWVEYRYDTLYAIKHQAQERL